jgi:3-deoxy-D-arabino-heptulosonate 7-phosphate (DAHP) synthase
VTTATAPVEVGGVRIGGGGPLALIAGPCAIEDEAHALRTAEALARLTAEAKVPFVYKSSYDKANRSALRSYRGPGLREGLRILARVRQSTTRRRSARPPRSSTPCRSRRSSAGRPTWSWPAARAAGRST